MKYKSILKIIFSPLLFIRRKIYWYFGTKNQKKYASWLYLKRFHKRINWKNPQDFNQKIQWLKFYSDTSRWPDLTDKYKVREYVKECGLGHILNELYTKYDSIEGIDIVNLPDSFVLKANNGYGDILIIQDKRQTNNDIIKKHFIKKLKYRHGILSAEPHYLKIKPCIIAEKLLVDHQAVSSSVLDYKLFCFNGKAEYILVCINRREANFSKCLYDLDWNIKTDCMKFNNRLFSSIPKPKSLFQMIEASEILSKGFPFVRIDFYEINEKPIFGEMTFTPGAGLLAYYTSGFLKEMGEKIQININIELLRQTNKQSTKLIYK